MRGGTPASAGWLRRLSRRCIGGSFRGLLLRLKGGVVLQSRSRGQSLSC